MPYFIVTYFYERKNTQLHMEKEEMIMKRRCFNKFTALLLATAMVFTMNGVTNLASAAKTKAKKKVHSIRLIAFCLSNSAFVRRFLPLLEDAPFFIFFVVAINVLYHVFRHEKRETSLS